MRLVVLTGAGLSAESGLATFRDAGGLWEGHDPVVVATPEAFATDPGLVHRFYDARRAALAQVEPNPAHRALARLEQTLGDDLLRAAWCTACDRRYEWHATLGDRPPCPGCGVQRLRPDVVWFGEIPYDLDRIETALHECDLFVSIGTSGVVHPAAGFVWHALASGAETLELNLEASGGSREFHASRRGLASELVPAWVEELVGAGDPDEQ